MIEDLGLRIYMNYHIKMYKKSATSKVLLHFPLV